MFLLPPGWLVRPEPKSHYTSPNYARPQRFLGRPKVGEQEGEETPVIIYVLYIQKDFSTFLNKTRLYLPVIHEHIALLTMTNQ